MKNKKTILVSGSLVYDRIMDFPGKFADHIMPDKIHILNVSFAVNGLKESFGGTAGNIAYNLALLGERSTVISTVGHDFLPYKKWLLKNKIDVSRVKTIKERKTASCYIITDKADNQITGFHADALNEGSFETPQPPFKKGGVSGRPSRLGGIKGGEGGFLAIISPGNIKDMENYVRFYKKVGIKYIFDPGQAITALSPNVLRASVKGAEALIGNDYEVSMISKKTGWTTNNLIDKVNMLIITKGEKGSEVYTNNKIPLHPLYTKGVIVHPKGRFKKIIISAVKVKRVVDPTGAGDAYRAGFIKGMIQGWEAKKCGQLASAVASFAVEKYGTQEHRFGWEEVRKRYKKSYKENF